MDVSWFCLAFLPTDTRPDTLAATPVTDAVSDTGAADTAAVAATAVAATAAATAAVVVVVDVVVDAVVDGLEAATTSVATPTAADTGAASSSSVCSSNFRFRSVALRVVTRPRIMFVWRDGRVSSRHRNGAHRQNVVAEQIHRLGRFTRHNGKQERKDVVYAR